MYISELMKTHMNKRMNTHIHEWIIEYKLIWGNE